MEWRYVVPPPGRRIAATGSAATTPWPTDQTLPCSRVSRLTRRCRAHDGPPTTHRNERGLPMSRWHQYRKMRIAVLVGASVGALVTTTLVGVGTSQAAGSQ